MRRLSLAAIVAVLAYGAGPSAQSDALTTAANTLGVANIKTLQFTGSGRNFSVGQNYTPSEAWPPVTVKAYTALINYDTGSMRQELTREMGAVMPRGGGAPFFGEQRQIQVVSGNYAWNVPVPPPAPAGGAAPAGGRGQAGPPPPAPQPGAQLERMMMLWATPQGFVKAAMANKATQKKAKGGTEVSFMVGGKYKMTGLINEQGQVVNVKTWIDQSIVGDMLVETMYTGYRDFGGVQFPSHIVQNQDGFPALDLTVSGVTINPPVDITVPANVPAFQPAAVTVTANKLGDGVYYLTGGTHHSLAVEMKDHIVLIDTPNGEERASAVIAKAKEVIPGKPIRFIVTSHHHWDHLGGIRTAMAEGATIVTHETNKAFLQRVAKTPHTIVPDKMAKAPKPVKIQTVKDKYVMTDGTRTIELHRLQGYDHTGDMLFVYLPKEKVIAGPDAFTPPATKEASLIPPAAVHAGQLYDNIQRLHLDVQVIAPFHGNRTSDLAELAKDAQKPAGAN